MARYRGPVCRLCRTEGKKLFLKGTRCDTPKCAMETKPYRPGVHGQARKKLSEYAIQLREKQSVRNKFSVSEKQFRRYYKEAVRRTGVTGTLLLKLLEFRLDNIVFISGLVSSRPQARQMVKHGHFRVNGIKVDIPSYHVKVGDVITGNDKSLKILKALTEDQPTRPTPRWMEADQNNFAVRIMDQPEREDMDPTIQENLIIEYYSR